MVTLEFANGFILRCTITAASAEGVHVRDAKGKSYKFLKELLSTKTRSSLGLD